jgi:hypothetical protein
MLCALPPAQAQGEVWTVEATPNFIFSGDNFNVTVTGQASSFVIMNIRSPNGTLFQDLSGFTNELGLLEFSIGVPLESGSGFYKLEVVVAGTIMANATVEVVKNDINWLYNLHLEDLEQIDRLNKIVYPLRTKVSQLQETISDQWIYIGVTLAYAALVTIVMLFLFKPWMEWRALRNKGNGTLVRSTRNFLHPTPESEFEHIDGVVANRDILLARQLDETGTRTYLVKADLKGEPKEVEEVEEVKIREAKIILPTGKGFEMKDAEVKQSRRSLFGGRRKVKQVRVLEAVPEAQEAPAPPPVSRKAVPRPKPVVKSEAEEFMEWRSAKAKAELRAVHEAQNGVVPRPPPRPKPELDPYVGTSEGRDVIDEMLAEKDDIIIGETKPLPSLYRKARDQVRNGRKGAGA